MLGDVAIVGAAGKMGSWFANYFSTRASMVSVFDIAKDSFDLLRHNVRIARSIAECVANAELVLVCVPIHVTPAIIKECELSMKSGAIIAEISSVKRSTFRALAKVRSDLQPLCIHPMFGPGANERKPIKILLVPVRNKQTEYKILTELFENAKVMIFPNSQAHDKAMAVILGLTYFTNIAFAKVISRMDLRTLKDISGTTFGLQIMLTESVLTDEPDLIVGLVKDNPLAASLIKDYLKKASATARLAMAKDRSNFQIEILRLKSKIGKQTDLERSYRLLYETMETAKD